MGEGQPGDDSLSEMMAAWRLWCLVTMREYHGRAFLWGEDAADEWLAERPPFVWVKGRS